MAQWRFRRMQPGEMNIDPIEAEFFSTEALDSLADALVREAIQNSLDARREGERLRMRIALSTVEGAAASALRARYLEGLRRHLAASRSGLEALPGSEEPVDCLVIEDFGTRGLQGDPAQTEDAELDAEGPRNDFYYFWRNVGRSRKSRSDLGRWGLGKTVFPAASRINTFFGLTVRADDRRRLLMGQSVLRIHKIDGERYYPYGYFGEFDGGFAHPSADAALLDAFSSEFGLARAADEPGLSIAVPWPELGMTAGALLPSVVRHYFVPILAGELAVVIDHARGRDRLDAGTLPRVLAEAEWAQALGLERLIELARFALGRPPEERIRLRAPPEDAAPRWHPTLFEDLPADAQARFDEGRPLAFTAPVWVKPAASEPVLSAFEVCLERDPSLARPEEHFVREGITVSGVRGGLPKGMRAIVIAHEAALAELLGDAENPAHTEWQERSPKFKNRYRHGPSTLRYIRNAAREIARALTRPAVGRDERLLEALFSLELPTEEAVLDPRRGHQPRGGPGASAGPEPVPARPSAPQRFQLHPLDGGFRLSGSGEGPVPREAAVQVAYEVRRGNPFAQYQPADFDLANGALRVETEGAAVVRRQRNLLVLRVEDAHFRVSVRGFDPHRDLRVRVVPSRDEAGA